jgi:23S rRNA-/tRNA-specific pseudouridylate synthase
MNIEVLFEDADLLAVNKPAGVLSVPDRWDKSKDSLVAVLQAQRPGQYLANVHRLDRNTSGTSLLAKNPEAFRRVAHQLRERSTRKLYLALVHGDFTEQERVIGLPIGPHPKRTGTKFPAEDKVRNLVPPWGTVLQHEAFPLAHREQPASLIILGRAGGSSRPIHMLRKCSGRITSPLRSASSG